MSAPAPHPTPQPTGTPELGDPVARAAHLAAMGRCGTFPRGGVGAALAALADPDPRVRTAALGAAMRGGGPRPRARAWRLAADDADPAVRRRAAELAPVLAPKRPTALLRLLADADVDVAETAAWAIGEIEWPAPGRSTVVHELSHVVTTHDDPLVREAAVAALGALGDPAGLGAILHACGDRPAVRRRAVLALAPFDGAAVDAALGAALDDRDWQVRQAAEDLVRAPEDTTPVRRPDRRVRCGDAP